AVDSPVAVGLAERPHVYRMTISAAPLGSPSTVIVKLPRLEDGELFDPASTDPSASRFFNEWACLEFLSELSSDPPAPRLYGADADNGILSLEDIAPGGSLDEALMAGDRVRATRLLVEQMRALGRMHAASFERNARFDELRRRGGPVPTRDPEQFREWLTRAV